MAVELWAMRVARCPMLIVCRQFPSHNELRAATAVLLRDGRAECPRLDCWVSPAAAELTEASRSNQQQDHPRTARRSHSDQEIPDSSMKCPDSTDCSATHCRAGARLAEQGTPETSGQSAFSVRRGALENRTSPQLTPALPRCSSWTPLKDASSSLSIPSVMSAGRAAIRDELSVSLVSTSQMACRQRKSAPQDQGSEAGQMAGYLGNLFPRGQ